MKTNEFGLRLSGAGYAPSILEPERAGCALCGRSWGAKLDRHEPWGGANREKSKGLGLWVSLCHWGCHEGPGSVHDDPARARALRRWAQAQAMAVYGWDVGEWRRRFGKSEIAEGEALEPILREGLSEFGMLNSKFGMMEARPAGRGGRFVNRPYGGGAKEGTDCHTSAAALVRNDKDKIPSESGRGPQGGTGFPLGIAPAPAGIAPPQQCARFGGFRVCLDGPELPY